jgi:hypothetical protein
MATVLVLDVNADKLRVAECIELEDFYRELDADMFDIAQRNIGGKAYDIFVDDIGLFRENPVVSAITKDLEPMLVGNLIFANHDVEGNTTSLTDEDMARILGNIVQVSTKNRPAGYKAVLCEY